MLKLKDEEILYILEVQLPEMLEREPNLESRAFRAFLRSFVTKEETAAIMAELHALHGDVLHFREEVDQRFEQVDQRFEQVDQRFEQVDQRFEQVDQRFGEVVQGLGQVRQEMSDLRHWAEYLSGRLQTRMGRNLEDVVAGALRSALRRSDIKPDQLRLRQKVVDTQGLVGLPGRRRFEIDILAQNGQLTVFEVKSYCEWEDVDHLADAVTLVRVLNPGRQVEGIMIALAIGDEVQTRCAELGVTLVYRGDEVPD